MSALIHRTALPRRLGLGLATAALIGAGMEAEAASTPGVVCTVMASGVNFGAYNPLSSSNVDGVGSVSVNCSILNIVATASYTISLDAGNGTISNRKLKSGSNTLLYNIYTDSARTTIWGDGSGGSTTISDSYGLSIGGNLTRTYTAYGRIPGSQSSASAGTYSDTLVVTVSY